MNISQQDIATYESQGFLFVPDLLPTQEVEALLREAENAIAAGRPGILFEKDGLTPRAIGNPQKYSALFQRLARHPRLVRPAVALLGSPVYVFQLAITYKSAFSGDSWWWHQDFPTYLADDGIADQRMVNTILFLDNVNEFNGPLMLSPGTHTINFPVPEKSTGGTSHSARYARNTDVEQLIASHGLVAPKGRGGSVIFQHTNVLHGSGPNLSPWRRAMVTLTFNSIENKPVRPSTRSQHLVPQEIVEVHELETDGIL
jgi:ectoine hydroxylase